MAESKWSGGGGGSGTGSVVGPVTSTDNAVARFNGVGGDSIQNSGVIVDDSNNVTGMKTLIVENNDDLSGSLLPVIEVKNANDAPTSSPHLQHTRSRAAGANLANGDTVGKIDFHSMQGGSSASTAKTEVKYTGDGTTRTADFLFYTSNAGAPAERLRITGAGSVQIAGLTASRAVATDANKGLVSSTATATELDYLSGVTSAIQTQLNGKQASGSYALTTGTLAQFAATTSLELKGVISDETGSGSLVFATSPTLVTPVLGVAAATSINKVAITTPATGSTLTIADGKTLTASNSLTFTGTDASSIAFGTGGTVAYTANKLSAFAATTSSELAGVISDETGSGVLVFGTSPVITTPTLAGGTASNTSRWTVPSDTLANLTALTRVEGVIVYATDTDKFYSDDGTSLNEVGSGTDLGINYIAAPSTAVGAVWSRTGTTGAAGNAPATTTTAGDLPLSPVINTAIKILSATSAAGEATAYVSAAFTTPATGAVKTQVSLFLRPGTNFISNEWTVSVYQGSTRQSLSSDSSSVTYLPNVTGNFNFTFDAAASTAYTLRIARITNAGANAAQLNLAAVSVGPGIITQGAAVTYIGRDTTLTTANFGTLTSVTVDYWRIGNILKARGRFTTGTLVASIASITLRDGHTADLGTATQIVGRFWNNTASATTRKAFPMVIGNGSTTLNITNDDYTAAADPGTPLNASTVANSTNVTWFEYEVPVSAWAGNGTVNLGAGAQVEYAYNSDVTSTANPGSNGAASSSTAGPAGVVFASAWAVGTTYQRRVVFQYPIQDDDLIEVQFYTPSVGWTNLADTIGGYLNTTSTYNYGAYIAPVVGATNAITVVFNNGGFGPPAAFGTATGSAWSAYNAGNYKWRVRKVKASSPVGFGLAGTDGSSGLVNPYTEGSGVVYGATYTPTLTNVTNVAASTSKICTYTRVGKIVTVTGYILVDVTTTATASQIDISLPIASDLTVDTDLNGVSSHAQASTAYAAGRIVGDTVNNRANVLWYSGGDGANREMSFTFTYIIK